MPSDLTAAVDQTIRARATAKLSAAEPAPAHDRRDAVEALIEAAHWAPFHRPAAAGHREALTSPVPWRVYALDAAGCRALREALGEAGARVAGLLAAADALLLVTWLPDPPSDGAAAGLFEPTLANMEHVAAAGAAVQNMLLAATARGLPTFWSSGGGILRTPETFARLGIPGGEILLASLYVFPAETPTEALAGSKLRATRGAASDAARWLDLSAA